MGFDEEPKIKSFAMDEFSSLSSTPGLVSSPLLMPMNASWSSLGQAPITAPPGLEFEFTLGGDEESSDSLMNEEVDFKLEGLGTFQSSLASLLGDILKPGRARTSSDLSNASTSIPDDSPPSTPTTSEELAGSAPCSLSSLEDIPVSDAVAADAVAAEKKVKKGWLTCSPSPDAKALPLNVEQDSEKMEAPNGPTTALLNNVPKKCTPEKLQERLAELKLLTDVDFMYLPMDLTMKGHVGHAVINFRTSAALDSFSEAFHKVSTKKAFPAFNTTGVCSVSLAPLQGKEANVASLHDKKNSLIMAMLADLPAWLPRLYDVLGEHIEFPQQSG